MSSILDALRRIEREEGTRPQAPFQLGTEYPGADSRLRWRWAGAAVAVTLTGAVAAFLWLSGTGILKDKGADRPPLSEDTQLAAVAQEDGTGRERGHLAVETPEGEEAPPPGSVVAAKKPLATVDEASSVPKRPGASPLTSTGTQAASEPANPAGTNEQVRESPPDAMVPGRERASLAEGVPEGSRWPAARPSAETDGGPPQHRLAPSSIPEPSAATASGSTELGSAPVPTDTSAARPARSLGDPGLRQRFAAKLAERMESADSPPGDAARTAAAPQGRTAATGRTEAEQEPSAPSARPEGSSVESPASFLNQPPPATNAAAPEISPLEDRALKPTILPPAVGRLDEADLRLPGPEVRPENLAGPEAGTKKGQQPNDAEEEIVHRRPTGAPYVRVSFLFYSSEPTRRRVMVTVNDGSLVTLFEGQSTNDLQVEKILRDEVYFRYQGKLFAVRPRS
jgi:hypothetical protein